MYLHNNTKDPPMFFTKHYISYQSPHVFSQNTSFYIKYLNLSKYKTCLYNLFCVFTQNTKDPPVFFSKTLRFISKRSSCVLIKHLNSSNYKTCLYNLFDLFTQKIPKTLLCFFHKTLHFISKRSSCVLTKHLNLSNYKNLFIQLILCLYTKYQRSSCVLTKHFFSQTFCHKSE